MSQQALAQLFDQAIAELEKRWPPKQEQWLEETHSFVADLTHKSAISQADRQLFRGMLDRISLYPKSTIADIEQVLDIKASL